MKYALIDVGSNTIRMVVYAIEGVAFEILFSKKYMAGLAGYVKNKTMTNDGIEKACDILHTCKALLSHFEIEKTAVFATASLRNVTNTKEIVDRIFLRTGYRLHVISGQEEALLDYFGVTHGIPMEKGILIDIGGGSTEIATFEHDGPGYMESLPIGSLSLYTAMVSKFLPNTEETEKIKERIQHELKKVQSQKLPSYDMICGVGGTIRAVMKLIQAKYELPTDTRSFTTVQFQALQKTLMKRNAETRKLLLRVCPDRVHTVLPGMFILDAILKQIQCKTIYVSAYGVREGYLLRHIIQEI